MALKVGTYLIGIISLPSSLRFDVSIIGVVGIRLVDSCNLQDKYLFSTVNLTLELINAQEILLLNCSKFSFRSFYLTMLP
jgi:hypothetical protein